MARAIARLSTREVSKATVAGMYADGGGLYLQVSDDGKGGVTKSWIYRFTLNGRTREMGLGPLHTVGLADARQKVLECRKLRLDGIDPIEARRLERRRAQLEAASSITFAECAEAYIEAHRPGWRSAKHAAQWSATLEDYAYPILGKVSVQSIDVGLVMKVIEPIWAEKTETASRVRGRIEAILDWAIARGLRRGDNPARWRGQLENLLPKRAIVRPVEHHRALPYADIGVFMARLRDQQGVSAAALEFAVLTATRTAEVTGARWSEIDLVERIWTIPGERIKDGREHRVPLSKPARAILRRMSEIRNGDFVFPGGKNEEPLSGMALLMLLRRMKRADLTVHGFRSTFLDWATQRTDFPREVAEMALAHAVDAKVEAAYGRGNLFQQRRQLMDAWAKQCESNRTGANVVPMHGTSGKMHGDR